ncbi:hypothetical protein [Cerasicoccus frondis]|uniref:hypothetical protein n=1 Tax=Cerasicoccus frondis TaxID=490090 RepID=UPI0028526414|nr:hypothetical protein [Cerasicoccus frondis]
MTDLFRTYLFKQKMLFNELKRRGIDPWDCNEDDVIGWECRSHGEHICCTNSDGEQIELPLLSITGIGIDAGHFKTWMESVNESVLDYAVIHQTLVSLEKSEMLTQVQSNPPTILWSLNEKTTGQDT